MTTDAQLRGMLLEEVLLVLLRLSGYRTIGRSNIDSDPTLCLHRAGIGVIGRGGTHQIDAIADFSVAHPFSHPQRLLIEAKCLSKKVGIGTLRNAVGVLKDVSEHWVTVNQKAPPSKRYHYQYALFSASGYSPDAQRYAFAQDVYLIPLANSKFFVPILDSIQEVRVEKFPMLSGRNGMKLTELRRIVRMVFTDEPEDQLNQSWEYHEISNNVGRLLEPVIDAMRQLRGVILGMIDRQFPILLVPNPGLNRHPLNHIDDGDTKVRIYWNFREWYLKSAETGDLLYSFDLPRELFELYAEGGLLTPERALQMKRDRMEEIQAITTVDNRIHVRTFSLDRDWINQLRSPSGQEL